MGIKDVAATDYYYTAPPNRTLITGAIAETCDRRQIFSTSSVLVSGAMKLTAIQLPAATPITTVTFFSGGTVPSGIGHEWAALYDSARALLVQSPDETTPTWTATTAKTFTFTAPFTTTYTGLYYLGIMEQGTTPNNLSGITTVINIGGAAPILSGTADTGLTTTAPNPATTITAATTFPYAYVS